MTLQLIAIKIIQFFIYQKSLDLKIKDLNFHSPKKKREKIKKIFEKGFEIEPDFLLIYIKISIQMREYSKIYFYQRGL